MKTLNNYDTSSTGVNIECTAYYDTHMSQIDFRENFTLLKGYKTRFSGDDVYFYTDNGNISDKGMTEYVIKGKVSDMKKLGEGVYVNIYRKEYKTLGDYKSDLVSELFAEYGFREAQEIASKHNVTISHKNDIRVISVRGYSQGDYAEIWVDFTECKRAWGNDANEDELRELFENLFYDAPIYATATVDEKEYYYWDMPELKSKYHWDRDAWIAYVKKESGHDISDYVPKEPDYN